MRKPPLGTPVHNGQGFVALLQHLRHIGGLVEGKVLLVPVSVPVFLGQTAGGSDSHWKPPKVWDGKVSERCPHWVVNRNAKRSKRSTLRVWAAREVLGKHCKVAACLPRSLVLGRARERILLLSSSTNGPLRQGVWAATTTMQLVRRMEWRPPSLYAYPLGHRVLDNLKNP